MYDVLSHSERSGPNGSAHLKLRLQKLFPFGPGPLYLFEFLPLGNFGSFGEQPMKCIYANVCKSELPDFELGN